MSMTTSHDQPNPTAVVEEFYAAYGADDLDRMRRVVAADVRWTIPGHHPMSGIKVGADEVIAYFQRLAKAGFQASTLVLGANDRYVVDCHRGWGAYGDHALDILWCLLYRIEDGRIIEVVNFAEDQHEADAFFWAVWGEDLVPIQERIRGGSDPSP